MAKLRIRERSVIRGRLSLAQIRVVQRCSQHVSGSVHDPEQATTTIRGLAEKYVRRDREGSYPQADPKARPTDQPRRRQHGASLPNAPQHTVGAPRAIRRRYPGPDFRKVVSGVTRERETPATTHARASL